MGRTKHKLKRDLLAHLYCSHVRLKDNVRIEQVQDLALFLLEMSDQRIAYAFALYFGMTDGEPKSYDEIGKYLDGIHPHTKLTVHSGLSGGRVRQLIARSFRMLYHPRNRNQLAKYLQIQDCSCGY